MFQPQRSSSGFQELMHSLSGPCLTHTLCIVTEEGLRGRNVLHSLCVHSCALMLNKISSKPLSVPYSGKFSRGFFFAVFLAIRENRSQAFTLRLKCTIHEMPKTNDPHYMTCIILCSRGIALKFSYSACLHSRYKPSRGVY